MGEGSPSLLGCLRPRHGQHGSWGLFLLRRMHPNLTKGFGMIGPKDFFPLLDFAFMPNNSLPPRYAGTPQHPPAWG